MMENSTTYFTDNRSTDVTINLGPCGVDKSWRTSAIIGWAMAGLLLSYIVFIPSVH